MAGSLEGRRALITGASSGIGEATALAMVAEGASVALGARREDRLEELAARIEGEGGRAVAIDADVADEESAGSLVETAHSELGGLDCLINNAGVMLLGPLQGADPSQWRTMIEVNCLGLLYCTHYALPLIRDGGGGDVVNVSSVAGRVAALGSGVYNMTKWGVVGFSESLRQEGADSASGSPASSPGSSKRSSRATTRTRSSSSRSRRCARRPARCSTPSDIADSIVYAVSRPAHVSINEMLVRPSGQAR